MRSVMLLFLVGCSGGPAALVDADGDGWTVDDGDCNDSDDSIHPGASDACVDGAPRDRNCDGYVSINGVDEFFITVVYLDEDGDGYGEEPREWGMCDPLGDGMVNNDDDCDDTDPDVGPHADEVPDNGRDDDCDGDIDEAF